MIKKTRILGKLFTSISNFGSPYLGYGLSLRSRIHLFDERIMTVSNVGYCENINQLIERV